MNEQELLAKYELDKPTFEAWGSFLIQAIEKDIVRHGLDLQTFLKIPTSARVKDNQSLVAKALFRKEKHYSDPYQQITDKVGIRFVVLELSDISIVKEIIEAHEDWNSSKDVDFERNRAEKPEIFEYQSVHYVIKNCNIINSNGVAVPAGTPCEIQIRTLLQHAYAELSHQTVYKNTAQIDPLVKRKLARSIALIEATDELFKEVRQDMRAVDQLYLSFIDAAKKQQRFSNYVESLNSCIFDLYKEIVQGYQISPDMVDAFLDEKTFIKNKVSRNICEDILFEQPIIYLLYYLASHYSSTAVDIWPFDSSYLTPIYTDLGISWN